MSFFLIFSDVSGIFLLPREVRALPWDEPPLHRSGAQITFSSETALKAQRGTPALSMWTVDCIVPPMRRLACGGWTLGCGLHIVRFFFPPGVHVTKQAEYNRRSLGVGGRESLGH